MSAAAVRKLYLASGNAGKLDEFRTLAAGQALDLDLLPGFSDIAEFPEDASTFAENAAGKALYYSRHGGPRQSGSPQNGETVFADDSGLVVPALGGAPGVHSARYAGAKASGEQNIAKLLEQLKAKEGLLRNAYFVCVIAVARHGRALAIVSGRVDGEILQEPRGSSGFGYDPVFYFPKLEKTFAELSAEEKNQHSHRGKAFRRMMEVLI
jgi:XTP/dITP diphosphohydrolase